MLVETWKLNLIIHLIIFIFKLMQHCLIAGSS